MFLSRLVCLSQYLKWKYLFRHWIIDITYWKLPLVQPPPKQILIAVQVKEPAQQTSPQSFISSFLYYKSNDKYTLEGNWQKNRLKTLFFYYMYVRKIDCYILGD